MTVAGQTIVALAAMPLGGVADWLSQLPAALTEEQRLLAEPILDDLHERIRRVLDVGVEYLSLDRATPSLSAGEARRLRMASLSDSAERGAVRIR